MLIKRILATALSLSLTLSLVSVRVSAAKVDLLNLNFDDVTLEEFSESEGITLYNGEAGDKLSIETENEATGNKAFKIFRPAATVADAGNKNGSGTDLGFMFQLPEGMDSGVVRISFKVRTADGYKFRSRWKALGTAITSDGENKAQFVTHSTYLYTKGTSVVVGKVDSNSWYTVSYDLYIDENKIKKGFNAEPGGDTVDCNAGDFGGISFSVAFTNAYWTSCNSGDLCYWVDDVKISADKLVVSDTSIDNKAENVDVEKEITLTFDSAVKTESLKDSNVSVKENGILKNASLKPVDNKTVVIEPEGGLQYNSQYEVVIKKGITSESGLTMAYDYAFSFKTLSIINTTLKNGERYTEGFIPAFEETNGISYEYKLTFEGTETEYNKTPINDVGDYSLKVTGTDSNGKKQEESYNFTIIGAVAPMARDVKIEGSPIVGTKLLGSYKYFDENGDSEGETLFKWYRSSEKDGKYKEIPDATTAEYTLTNEDEDSYIKFAVIPVALDAPYEGEESFSEIFVSAMNPVIKSIAVTGDIGEGSELSVSYDYYDENGDADEGTVITWYSSSSEDGEYKKIGEGEKYTLTKAENDCYIKVGIVPKNSGSGSQVKEFFSEIFIGPSKPVAKDVEIIGNPNAGTAVGVQYKYDDKNSDPEGETLIKWYVGGVLKSESESYTITTADKGKEIYVSVTPVSTVAPFEGEPVLSAVKRITASSNTSVSSGGKNTGGGGGGGSTLIVPITPEVVEKSEDVYIANPEESLFADISNHWAKNDIIKIAELGIINGKGDKLFAPDDSIKRGEFAAIIARAYSLSSDTAEPEFADISTDDWCYSAVEAVVKAGIMKGSDGKFRPWDNITRQEIAVVLANIARGKSLQGKIEVPEFADSEKIADWAKADVMYAAELGLLNGVDSSYFAPTSDATRAQVVVIIKRLLEI